MIRFYIKFSRVKQAFQFSISTLLLPAYSLFISFFVIHFFTKNLWGEFSKVILVVNLACYFLSYGNKDYLIKKFSEQPAHINQVWQQCLLSRLLLFLIVVPVLFTLPFELSIKFLLMLWLGIRFLYMSYDSKVVFNKKFIYTGYAETCGLVVLVLLLLFYSSTLLLTNLVVLFVATDFIKLVVLFFLMRERNKNPISFDVNLSYLKSAFPFFLLTFCGLLQSRADQLCVNALLTTAEIGEYQVIMSLLLYALAVPNYIIVPQLRSYYRLSKIQFKKLIINVVWLGFGFVPIIVCLIYLVLKTMYGIEINFLHAVCATLFLLPVFFYTTVVYFSFKHNEQSFVVLITFTGIVLNVILCVLFIPKNGISGALVAAVISQWGMLLLYVLLLRKIFKNDSANESV